MHRTACDDLNVSVTASRDSLGFKIGYILFMLVLAAGCIAASAVLIRRVFQAHVYYGGLWLPCAIIGFLVGVGLPLVVIRTWRTRKNLAGALAVIDFVALVLGYVKFTHRPVRPAVRPASGVIPLHSLPELSFAALTATSVIIASVGFLVLIVIGLRDEIRFGGPRPGPRPS
jgi:hypothetical protein